MATKATIITCPNCARKNRVRPRPRGVPQCSVCHAPLPWIVDADTDSFDEEISSSLPVLVDLWAPWCGPCRMVSPVVERMADDLAGRLKVVRLNVDDAPQISARYSLQGIPVLLLLRDGHEIDRIVGATPAARLRDWLERHLAAAGETVGKSSTQASDG